MQFNCIPFQHFPLHLSHLNQKIRTQIIFNKVKCSIILKNLILILCKKCSFYFKTNVTSYLLRILTSIYDQRFTTLPQEGVQKRQISAFQNRVQLFNWKKIQEFGTLHHCFCYMQLKNKIK